jgi:hypothetical protein
LENSGLVGAGLFLHDQPIAKALVISLVVVQLINTTPIAVVIRGKFIIRGTRGTGALAVWIYEIRMGRAQSAARGGLEPTQKANLRI